MARAINKIPIEINFAFLLLLRDGSPGLGERLLSFVVFIATHISFTLPWLLWKLLLPFVCLRHARRKIHVERGCERKIDIFKRQRWIPFKIQSKVEVIFGEKFFTTEFRAW